MWGQANTTAPTVVITYPVNESTLTETTTVTVDVADDGDIGIVKLLVDGVETYADTTAPYQFQWDVCVQATGNHTLLAKTEDGAGNQGQSDLLTFTINASYDCASVCGGDKLLDNCEVCDADSSNDCVQDCADVWGGYSAMLWGECYSIEETTHLSLDNNQLSGVIPIEIGNLTNLTYLDLSSNQLTGDIPQEVCDLIESNNLNMDYILYNNNLINTCD